MLTKKCQQNTNNPKGSVADMNSIVGVCWGVATIEAKGTRED